MRIGSFLNHIAAGGKRYGDADTLWDKLKDRFFTWMIDGRDLYFIMGMYSQYPTWFIVGIYYPPK